MIEFTGERVVPGQINDDLWNEHVARYRFAAGLARGRRVLDAGCGTGYGSALLARAGGDVLGIDLAADATSYARVHYSGPHVGLAQGDSAQLPFADGSFGLVVAFEVIEHLENWQGLLAESRRALNDGGHLVVSTPNREYYARARDEPNPFHVHEFDFDEFAGALHEYFPHVDVYAQNHAAGIVLAALDERPTSAHLEQAKSNPSDANFFVAVCGVGAPGGLDGMVFVPSAANVLQEREKHIDKLEGELAQKEQWLKASTADLAELQGRHEQMQSRFHADQGEYQKAVSRLEGELAQAHAWGKRIEADLRAELDSREKWARELEQRLTTELAEEREAFAAAQADHEKTQGELKKAIEAIDEAEGRVKERTTWAQRLDRELEAIRSELGQIYASWPYRIGRKAGLVPKPIRAPEEDGDS